MKLCCALILVSVGSISTFVSNLFIGDALIRLVSVRPVAISFVVSSLTFTFASLMPALVEDSSGLESPFGVSFCELSVTSVCPTSTTCSSSFSALGSSWSGGTLFFEF